MLSIQAEYISVAHPESYLVIYVSCLSFHFHFYSMLFGPAGWAASKGVQPVENIKRYRGLEVWLDTDLEGGWGWLL